MHIFLHHHHVEHHGEHSHKTENFHNDYTTSVKEKCAVCDFKFATFLSTEIFTFSFYSPFKQSQYSFSIKENDSFFVGSLFSHRGPPVLN